MAGVLCRQKKEKNRRNERGRNWCKLLARLPTILRNIPLPARLILNSTLRQESWQPAHIHTRTHTHTHALLACRHSLAYGAANIRLPITLPHIQVIICSLILMLPVLTLPNKLRKAKVSGWWCHCCVHMAAACMDRAMGMRGRNHVACGRSPHVLVPLTPWQDMTNHSLNRSHCAQAARAAGRSAGRQVSGHLLALSDSSA